MTTTKKIRKEIKDSFVEPGTIIKRQTPLPLCDAVKHVENLAKTQIGLQQVFIITVTKKFKGILVEATGRPTILFTKP